MNREVINAFVTVANVLVFIFSIFAISLIACAICGIFKLCADRKNVSFLKNKSDIELLIELAQTKSSAEKANIFVSLIFAGYVLNHKIVNAGGKYDDEKQQERFNRFLTPTAVKKLNTMDGTVL